MLTIYLSFRRCGSSFDLAFNTVFMMCVVENITQVDRIADMKTNLELPHHG